MLPHKLKKEEHSDNSNKYKEAGGYARTMFFFASLNRNERSLR
jgi:hypothetical protein